jgi:ribonuclease D
MKEYELIIIENENDYTKKIINLLDTTKIIYLDCEGNKLDKNGKLSIIQVGIFQNEKMYIMLFDVLEMGVDFIQKNIGKYLEDIKIQKVIHDVKRDSEALYWQCNINLKNIFDTQIAYQEIESEYGKKVMNIGFVDLLKEYCEIDYSSKNELPHVTIQDAR